MLKKTKKVYKEISEEINNAFEYNKNIKEGFTPIRNISFKISRGLYNYGATNIMNEVRKEMGQIDESNPFYIEVHDDEDYCQLFIRLGKMPKKYGMER